MPPILDYDYGGSSMDYPGSMDDYPNPKSNKLMNSGPSRQQQNQNARFSNGLRLLPLRNGKRSHQQDKWIWN